MTARGYRGGMTPIDFDTTRRAALDRVEHHERMAAQWRRLLASLGEERDNGRPGEAHAPTCSELPRLIDLRLFEHQKRQKRHD